MTVGSRTGGNPDFEELFEEIEDSLAPKEGRRKIRVLVFGPDLKSNKPSARLRKYIIDKYTNDEYTVVLAEHDEIKRFYEKRFHSAHNLCRMEYHLATAKAKGRDIIDGIVIIPDSEGSFIELGMLVIDHYQELHHKILVLFNKSYRSHMKASFVGLGAKAALDNKAKTKLVDYDKKDIAFTEVCKFLACIRDEHVWNTWIRGK
jgi:hypothetical protein